MHASAAVAPYTGHMPAPGDATAHMRQMTDSFHAACAAIAAHGDPREAWYMSAALAALIQDMSVQSAGFRAWYGKHVMASRGLNTTAAGAALGLSRQRLERIIGGHLAMQSYLEAHKAAGYQDG